MPLQYFASLVCPPAQPGHRLLDALLRILLRAEEWVCPQVEGLFRTERSSPDMFDGSIEARVAMGDVPGALERTREALAPFPDFEHYQVAEQALTAAANGQTSEAVAMLRENGHPVLLRIADKLEAP